MGNLRCFPVSLFNAIYVDEVEGKVIRIDYGVPRLYRDTVERGEDSFEQVLDIKLAELEGTMVEELKKYSNTDLILKNAFKRVYRKKIIQANYYKLEDWKNSLL